MLSGTKKPALKRVVRTFLNEKDALVHVQVNGATITCATEHPFYVRGKGWVAAGELKIGDKLELQNGANAFIEAVHHEKLAKPIQVYNFEVEDFHTYYVGPACVLMHNLCKQQTVVAERKYSAKVSVGGENSRHVPHAHIFEKSTKVASVNVKVDIISGTLNRAGKKFVKNIFRKSPKEYGRIIRRNYRMEVSVWTLTSL